MQTWVEAVDKHLNKHFPGLEASAPSTPAGWKYEWESPPGFDGSPPGSFRHK